jgi:glycosyltransferase involved in cell wall biosynthesis
VEQDSNQYELSIVMPCLNEAKTVGICVQKARTFLLKNDIAGEVIVADNGSTDGSIDIANNQGATVIHVKEKGYGNALMSGINASKGKFIIMADSDDSYDFSDLMPFVNKLREGYHLVVGNRFLNKIDPKAMPWHHKYIGNPVLSKIGKLFFKSKVNDFHCGLRGFSKEAFRIMDLRTTGMEFASEMVVKATLWGLKITEVPTTLSPDGRTGRSHLRSFRDGWRHLLFLLIYSPRWLFLYPGIFLMIAGFGVGIWILPRSDNSTPDLHTMLYGVAFILLGFQAVIFAVLTKTFAVHERLIPTNSAIESFFNKMTPNKGLLLGFLLVLLGLAGSFYTYYIWVEGLFFQLGKAVTLRLVIASFTLLVLGFQLMFSSFFYALLKLENK